MWFICGSWNLVLPFWPLEQKVDSHHSPCLLAQAYVVKKYIIAQRQKHGLYLHYGLSLTLTLTAPLIAPRLCMMEMI